MTLQQQGAKRFILIARTVFENSDKILTFVSLQADVNFETFADAFSLLDNSSKFLPILFELYNRRIEKNFQGAKKKSICQGFLGN